MPINNYNNDQISYLDKKKNPYLLTISMHYTNYWLVIYIKPKTFDLYDEIECKRNKYTENELPTLNGQSEPIHFEFFSS